MATPPTQVIEGSSEDEMYVSPNQAFSYPTPAQREYSSSDEEEEDEEMYVPPTPIESVHEEYDQESEHSFHSNHDIDFIKVMMQNINQKVQRIVDLQEINNAQWERTDEDLGNRVEYIQEKVNKMDENIKKGFKSIKDTVRESYSLM